MARLQETARENVKFRTKVDLNVVCDCFVGVKEKLTVPSEATGAAAFERTLLLVMLQQLRSSPLRLLHVDINSGEAANPAVLIISRRRAPRLGAAQQTQDC